MKFRNSNEEIVRLLDKVCIDLGFCLSSNDRDRISSFEKWDADTFAKDVVSAEGLDPDNEIKWIREIKNMFIQQFGTNIYEGTPGK